MSLSKLLTLICLTAPVALAGCANKTAQIGGTASRVPVEYCRPAVPQPELTLATVQRSVEPAVVPEAAVAKAAVPDGSPDNEGVTASLTPLDRLFFDFDSYLLTPDARSTLDLIYDRLGASDRSYTLEGYCDERGDDEYNLALGERRAAAARAYLVARGIAAERLRTISYGRDFPADPERTEEAYQRNRRVEVVDADSPGPEKRYGTEVTAP